MILMKSKLLILLSLAYLLSCLRNYCMCIHIRTYKHTHTYITHTKMNIEDQLTFFLPFSPRTQLVEICCLH